MPDHERKTPNSRRDLMRLAGSGAMALALGAKDAASSS
ncbi:MAG TPA: twin-arginine translocation signal domain-containing protein [Burkholderiales bacterium]|nr:twin-arginine translocation signal domain-containing protein [Burkholderiales bacterium]